MEDLPPGWQQFADPNNPAPGFQPLPGGGQPHGDVGTPSAGPAPGGQFVLPPVGAVPNQGQPAPGSP